jgi:hypothetical protein
MAKKTWVLDTETKGTGAQMVPLEKALEQKERKQPAAPRKRAEPARAQRPAPSKPGRPVQRTATALAPGQVRKKATGEIGTVQAVDPKAGTATVRWLKRGATSTVPLSSITRK